MAARSPARFLAPLALLAVAVALFMIVSRASTEGGSSGSTTSTPTPAARPARHAGRRHKHAPRFYTVKPGDTPSGIAEKTGVSLAKLEELNPSLDPAALAPGTKLKLR